MPLDFYIEKILNNDLIAIPTETVYGLAGRIDSEVALKKIFHLKQRPFFDPLIVHIHNQKQAVELSLDWNPICQVLAENFWPGPLTIITQKSSKVNPLITSGLETVGLRIPRHNLTLELLKKLDIPLAAPSANLFKQTSPTKAQHVKETFPQLDILDGGDCEIGIESTVLEVKQNKIFIYRPGIITSKEIQAILDENNLKDIEIVKTQSPVSPGNMEHHYMPKTPIVSFATNSLAQTLSILEKQQADLIKSPYIWCLPDRPIEVARDFYASLREIDKNNHSSILIQFDKDFKNKEQWEGILNRLEKASSFNFE